MNPFRTRLAQIRRFARGVYAPHKLALRQDVPKTLRALGVPSPSIVTARNTRTAPPPRDALARNTQTRAAPRAAEPRAQSRTELQAEPWGAEPRVAEPRAQPVTRAVTPPVETQNDSVSELRDAVIQTQPLETQPPLESENVAEVKLLEEGISSADLETEDAPPEMVRSEDAMGENLSVEETEEFALEANRLETAELEETGTDETPVTASSEFGESTHVPGVLVEAGVETPRSLESSSESKTQTETLESSPTETLEVTASQPAEGGTMPAEPKAEPQRSETIKDRLERVWNPSSARLETPTDLQPGLSAERPAETRTSDAGSPLETAATVEESTARAEAETVERVPETRVLDEPVADIGETRTSRTEPTHLKAGEASSADSVPVPSDEISTNEPTTLTATSDPSPSLALESAPTDVVSLEPQLLEGARITERKTPVSAPQSLETPRERSANPNVTDTTPSLESNAPPPATPETPPAPDALESRPTTPASPATSSSSSHRVIEEYRARPPRNLPPRPVKVEAPAEDTAPSDTPMRSPLEWMKALQQTYTEPGTVDANPPQSLEAAIVGGESVNSESVNTPLEVAPDALEHPEVASNPGVSAAANSASEHLERDTDSSLELAVDAEQPTSQNGEKRSVADWQRALSRAFNPAAATLTSSDNTEPNTNAPSSQADTSASVNPVSSPARRVVAPLTAETRGVGGSSPRSLSSASEPGVAPDARPTRRFIEPRTNQGRSPTASFDSSTPAPRVGRVASSVPATNSRSEHSAHLESPQPDAPASDARSSGATEWRDATLPRAARGAAVASDPRAAPLVEERRVLESRIDSLRSRRSTMNEEAYQKALEPLLVELAEKTRALRALEARKP
ncbi:MAG: hypothetical protein HC933_09010 [Pleurocapsa sp. SU_196_0]|nr:hypothetical protein [Pleurocapsa sp. SU_196_0]